MLIREEDYVIAGTTSGATVGWSDDAIEFSVGVDPAGIARITRFRAPAIRGGPAGGSAPARGSGPARPAAGTAGPHEMGLPLVDVVLAGEGKTWSGRRYCESAAGARLRYAGHQDSGEPATAGAWCQLRVDLDDPVTGLRAEVFYRLLTGHGALRSWVRLVNRGSQPVIMESVTSFLCGSLSGGGAAPGVPDDLGALDLRWAENDWLAEGRWQRRSLRDALPDLHRGAQSADPRGSFGLTSTGTWSSGTFLPMGAVVNRGTRHTWIWQIEHQGAWHWQVGEGTRRAAPDVAAGTADPGTGVPTAGGAYLALLGPADTEHQWRIRLAPGESFTTVAVGLAVSADGFDGALGCLTAYRRAIRRPHEDHRRLPVIFNDYMNTLMGDPTTQRLRPLISAAAAAGAEYFCIDAGWYADLDEGWWDTVGAWRPSASRFPDGLSEVLDHIRAAGLVPGLWLEPEVVGVRSPVAAQLPDGAFFSRGGQRVVEHGRYHLDLRHPAAVKHLDETIDYLAGDLGVGYFKLDYNINGGPGTDVSAPSAGAGLLGHNRAHLDWLDAVLDRHPGLVIENCSSGGMRTDYALLSRLQLQSTSDQQDFLRYAAIAAAAPAAIAPEQAAVWAYPQPGFTEHEIVFTLCNALLGRVHLSGHLNRMDEAQQRLVAEAVRVYKRIRLDLAQAFPFWPLGLPRWPDSWLAAGMRAPSATYLVAWHRGGPANGGPAPDSGPSRAILDPAHARLPVPHLRGRAVTACVLYPEDGPAAVSWDAGRGEVTVALPAPPSACPIQLW